MEAEKDIALTDLDEDEKEILESLNMRKSEKDVNRILIDLPNFQDTLKKIKTKSHEAMSFENDLFGFRVSMISNKLRADELLGLAHSSLNKLIAERKVFIPLGVG